MRKIIAISIAGTVGETTKMPCKSYGLPAVSACITGGKLAQVNGTICASCYATRGMYQFQNVQNSQATRLASLRDPLWVDALVTLIGDDRYFRWHDSGDLQGVWHLEKIVEVCLRTPHCKHWLPTRERRMVEEFVQVRLLPKNLIIRMSATRFDERPKPIKGLMLTSGSHKHEPPIGHECQAPAQGGSCEDCRKCWDKRVLHVSYHNH